MFHQRVVVVFCYTYHEVVINPTRDRSVFVDIWQSMPLQLAVLTRVFRSDFIWANNGPCPMGEKTNTICMHRFLTPPPYAIASLLHCLVTGVFVSQPNALVSLGGKDGAHIMRFVDYGLSRACCIVFMSVWLALYVSKTFFFQV